MSRESDWIAREISAKVRREFNGRLPKPPEVLPAEAQRCSSRAAAMTGADLIRGIGMWAVHTRRVLCWYLAPGVDDATEGFLLLLQSPVSLWRALPPTMGDSGSSASWYSAVWGVDAVWMT